MLSKKSVFSIGLPLMRHIRLELGLSLPLKLPHFAGGYANDADPRANPATTKVFERSPLVIAIARIRANHRCEVPGCQHPVFICADGRSYSEVHHIVPLGEGGEDTPANSPSRINRDIMTVSKADRWPEASIGAAARRERARATQFGCFKMKQTSWSPPSRLCLCPGSPR